jgi:catechol 2,3-dioxygenase-like lactoylglutathione lyase family enzyme
VRRLSRPIALSVASALVLAAFAPRADAAAAVEAVSRAGFTVSDLEASVAFFTRVLDFEKVSEREMAGEGIEHLTGAFPARVRVALLRLGSEELELDEYLAPAGRPFPADARADDLWFQHVAIVVSDMDAAYARLREHRVRHASSGPQRLPDWNANAGGIEAFYFRDPDGHFLELIHFPKGKGNPRWQDAQGRLFLGIDHTAIAVRDTEASLAFYRDLLGLRIAGSSENYGSEQEHLNGVFGARLRITGLTAGRGPGIELLEYLSPSGGRPRPADARASDLLAWHTDLAVRDLRAAEQALDHAHVDFDSPGAVEVDGIGTALTAADPDGHRLRLIQGESR